MDTEEISKILTIKAIAILIGRYPGMGTRIIVRIPKDLFHRISAPVLTGIKTRIEIIENILGEIRIPILGFMMTSLLTLPQLLMGRIRL